MSSADKFGLSNGWQISWAPVWLADCQQVSTRGGNLQGQAQRTVTAAGRRAGYVWRPTDCIICCPLFVACCPLFWGVGCQAGYAILMLLFNQFVPFSLFFALLLKLLGTCGRA